MRFNTMDSIRPDQLDFVPRERRSRVFRVIMAFAVISALIFILAYAPALSHYAAYTPLIAILLMAILCLYVVYHEQIILDLVLSTEYQNMLFAQALSLGSSFLMIVRRDGTIVHASDGLADILPNFDYAQSQALDGLFTLGTVRKTDRERIMSAIYSNTPEHLVFPIIAQYQAPKDYIITVEPMARPTGFSMVRGREYLGQQKSLLRLPDSLSATSMDKIEHLLATTNVGHFTTDAYGRFEYVNPAFEAVLGYANGEIVESKLSLHHLFFSFGAFALTEEYHLGDYAGSATMLSKNGDRTTIEMRQLVVRNAQSKMMGATGTIIMQGAV
jgi:PAS domain S-box-containing protein